MKLTRKQQNMLTDLIDQNEIEQNAQNRFILERFAKEGLAFKNKRTRVVTTKGKVRGGNTKYVQYVFYTPSPTGMREHENVVAAES